MNRSVVVTLTLLGCSEWGLSDPPPSYGNPSPRPVAEDTQTDVIHGR
jgi:hypothetical protein